MPLVTVKAAVSAAAMEIGIAQQPVTAVFGSQDQDINQMAALLSAVADEVLMEQPYASTLGDGNWILTPSNVQQSAPTGDDDLILFDGRLAINGLKFRFLKQKGLEYGEDMRDFTVRMNKLASKANARVLHLDDEAGRIQ